MLETILQPADTKAFRQQWIEHIYSLQDAICKAMEAIDGKALFKEDAWQRAEGRGGGGLTKVMTNGDVFEKAGINTSVVYGHVTDKMRTHLNMDGDTWFAAGLSLVLHPLNPFVPTVHANWRYFELYKNYAVCDRWFGGGSDLTPYYLFEDDAVHFHAAFKKAIDPFNELWYTEFKKRCDQYFVNSHRDNEMRGIGGVFYDYLRPANEAEAEQLLLFQQANGDAFLKAYVPIAEKRKNTIWNAGNKHWQEIRRGRYTEFNLLHDRGTLFGLKTHGRTESILMSLPPTVRFEYDYKPLPGSEEDKLLQACLHPREWI